MNKIRITAVSYLNTLPFVYGLKHARNKDDFELLLDVPSMCAHHIINGKADIGLIPVGALSLIARPYKILDYCIAADGEVSSVLLLSHVATEKIQNVYLDSDSRTSVLLARVLASRKWHIDPEWTHLAFDKNGELPESMVVIGDKAFEYKTRYRYCLDLSSEWKALTGLPFVFAVWIASEGTDEGFLKKLSEALSYGILHIDETITERRLQGAVDIDLKDYYSRCIHFRLEEKYKVGMDLFLKYVRELPK